MFNLLKMEHQKLLYQKSTAALFITLAVISFLLAAGSKQMFTGAGVGENVIGYLSFSTGTLFILPFFSLVIAGAIVANEFNWGTIKFLLIRPKTRSKILAAKFLTALLFGVYFLLAYFLFSVILGFVFFGASVAPDDKLMAESIGLQYLTAFIEIVLISGFAFMISSVFRNSSLAIGLSIVLTFSGKIMVQLMAHYGMNWGKYILFANTNLKQHLQGNRPLFEGMTLGFSMSVLFVYLLIFLLASWAAFTKRDVSI